MKADKLVIGQKIKYGYTVLSVDLQDKRFVYIKSDKNGTIKRVLINRIRPLK